mmetsp:Transcript_103108/g.292056  ORF Transcript_103108/g.292056 Transcript_103108/m.292056 type:complete len:95 (-) Transcript_103108:1071-1355(-)
MRDRFARATSHPPKRRESIEGVGREAMARRMAVRHCGGTRQICFCEAELQQPAAHVAALASTLCSGPPGGCDQHVGLRASGARDGEEKKKKEGE